MIRSLVADAFARNRVLAWATALHLLLFVALIPFARLDPAQLFGISRWIKPMKFAISVPIFMATMIYVLSWLPRSRSRTAIGYAVALTMSIEMVLITLQAARGVPSHFNHATAFDDAVFSAMGILIAVNTAAVLHTVVLFFTQPTALRPAHLTGVRLGLILFVAASLEGGLMVARDAHSVGVHDGGPGLPFVNWSTGAGDLRIAHFVGLHALQALPIIGWWLDASGVRAGRACVAAVAAAWAIVTVLLVLQALAGQPLIPAIA
jgi:hypothetical protein